MLSDDQAYEFGSEYGSDASPADSPMDAAASEYDGFQPNSRDMSMNTWSDEQTIWQGQFQPATNVSSMSPAQEQFYQNYLNGLFSALGMNDIAACFQADGSADNEFYATFPTSEYATVE
jgi:hypothetical protein